MLSKDRTGNVFLLNLANYLDARLYLSGAYEEEELRAFCDLVRKYGCTEFVDVGANIGLYTVTIGKIPSINLIYAFEPDLLNRQQLIANILLNGLSQKVHVHGVALSSTEGVATLYRCSQPKEFDAYKANTGAHSLHYNPKWHDETLTIECKRGDDILTLRDKSIAIKIDVEGHELHVLEGMRELLTTNTCIILIESLPERYQSVDNFLHDIGYVRSRTLKDHNYIFTKLLPSS